MHLPWSSDILMLAMMTSMKSWSPFWTLKTDIKYHKALYRFWLPHMTHTFILLSEITVDMVLYLIDEFLSIEDNRYSRCIHTQIYKQEKIFFSIMIFVNFKQKRNIMLCACSQFILLGSQTAWHLSQQYYTGWHPVYSSADILSRKAKSKSALL